MLRRSSGPQQAVVKLAAQASIGERVPEDRTMSTHEKDAAIDSLLSRRDMRLINVKFCRGAADVIAPAELCAQIASSTVQVKTNPDVKLTTPPRTGRKPVNVREFVAKL